jgi:hypothetical protein
MYQFGIGYNKSTGQEVIEKERERQYPNLLL